MEDAMDAFVDSMDLTTAGPPDEDGCISSCPQGSLSFTNPSTHSEPTDWFTVSDSYSPAIHNIQNTLVFRLSNPDSELPPVPRILTKYMDPPPSLVEKAAPAREEAIEAFDIKLGAAFLFLSSTAS